MAHQTILTFHTDGRGTRDITGLTVPVGDGQLLLGTWQGIYLWEHRSASHRRTVVVTVLGG